MEQFIGCDAHKKFSIFVAVDEKGKTSKPVRVEHTRDSLRAYRSFTGMNQDTVSALYDFPAREYGIQGRWPSPDLAGMSAVDPTDPQTWNRYAYVRNNPLGYIDPSGEMMIQNEGLYFLGGVADFGSDWNEFYMMETPIPVSGYGFFTVGQVTTLIGGQPGPSQTSLFWGNGVIGYFDVTSIEDSSLPSPPGVSPLQAGATPPQSPKPQAPANTSGTTTFQKAKTWTTNFLCGASPTDDIGQWMKDGVIKGVVVGGVAGGFTGAVLGEGVGAPFGAILGGLVEGTTGAVSGIVGGAIAGGICSAAGVYGN